MRKTFNRQVYTVYTVLCVYTVYTVLCVLQTMSQNLRFNGFVSLFTVVSVWF